MAAEPQRMTRENGWSGQARLLEKQPRAVHVGEAGMSWLVLWGVPMLMGPFGVWHQYCRESQ